MTYGHKHFRRNIGPLETLILAIDRPRDSVLLLDQFLHVGTQGEECQLVGLCDVQETGAMGVEAPHFVVETHDGNVGQCREHL